MSEDHHLKEQMFLTDCLRPSHAEVAVRNQLKIITFFKDAEFSSAQTL